MKCKHCGSENIIESVEFGYKDIFYHVGPKYKGFGLGSQSEVTYCDFCEDCGVIQRIFIKPGTKRKWITNNINHEEMVQNASKEKLSEEDENTMQEEIHKYEEMLRNNLCTKIYVKDLKQYDKHKFYDRPVRSKGPSYRLYVEKLTEKVVLIKPSTMNLDKGNYVVCIPPEEKNVWLD